MMIAARLNNAHEKEKVKRQIKEEESEESKRERQREWRNQVSFSFIKCISSILKISVFDIFG